jgi:hypothetical protein
VFKLAKKAFAKICAFQNGAERTILFLFSIYVKTGFTGIYPIKKLQKTVDYS